MYVFLVLVAQFVIAPKLLGNLITYKDETLGMGNGPVTYVLGLFASFGIFQVMFLPFCLLKGSFTALCVSYAVVVVGLCIGSAWLNRRAEDVSKGDSQSAGASSDSSVERPKTVSLENVLKEKSGMLEDNIFTKVYFILFILVVAGQLLFAVMYQSNEMSFDDYEYVAVANDNVVSDRICATHPYNGLEWRVSPRYGMISWVSFSGYLARITGVSVATMCHTILATVLLIIAYVVYDVVARFLFKEQEKRVIFLLLLAVALTFGFYSHNAVSFRLFATLWQGKAVFACLAMPFLLAFLPKLYDEEFSLQRLGMLLFVTSGIASFTLMGAVLMCVVLVGMAVLVSIYRRKFLGFRYALTCCLMPVIQAGLYLYIYEVVYGY